MALEKETHSRVYKSMQYNYRFVTAIVGFGKKRGCTAKKP